MKNNKTLISAFCVALVDSKTKLSFKEVNEVANKYGYLVHPDVCNKEVLKFIKENTINYNSTFYKTWEDVTSKSRIELFFDQMLHYCSTYGTDFELGNGYVPNDGEQDVPSFEKYKVIMPITEEELFDKCFGLIESGIALKQETVGAVCDYVIGFYQENKETYSIDVDSIKNREAQTIICTRLNIFPKDKFSLLRYIIYVTTGKTMIIKDKDMLFSIKCSLTPFDFSRLSEDNLKALASIFLRYKDIILAFKHNTRIDNKSIINKLRKMAVKYHKPMKQGFWQTVFTEEKSAEELLNEVDKLDNFKKVAIMQSCIDRATALENQIYLVRNQKLYLREGYKPSKVDNNYYFLVYTILYSSLVESLSKKATKKAVVDDKETETKKIIRMNSNVSIALPTSEKSFIGNYPFGTTIGMTENNIFGIYWRNEWGTYDFDLSMIDAYGNKIGWNSNYYNSENNVVFSGDMTNAEPEATELLYAKKGCPNGVIRVNQYYGEPNSKFKFFFAQEEISKMEMNYMVNPNSVKFEVEVPVEKREQQIAVVCDNSIVLMTVNTGNRNVSALKKEHAEMVTNSVMHKAKCFIQSRDILEDCGYTIVDENYEGEVDIDFTNMSKDTIIDLMK